MEVIDYPKYLIYPDGKVQNKRTKNYIKPNIGTTGYYYVKLYRDDWKEKHTCNKIHRLIALHYIPNPEEKSFIDHKDRNRLNNDIDNLRWVTHKENLNNSFIPITNTSGYMNISWDKTHSKWIWRKKINDKYKCRTFKTKKEAIIYKFIFDNFLKSQNLKTK